MLYIEDDFRSKSVDTTKVADIEVGEGGNEVTVTMPHVDVCGHIIPSQNIILNEV